MRAEDLGKVSKLIEQRRATADALRALAKPDTVLSVVIREGGGEGKSHAAVLAPTRRPQVEADLTESLAGIDADLARLGVNV